MAKNFDKQKLFFSKNSVWGSVKNPIFRGVNEKPIYPNALYVFAVQLASYRINRLIRGHLFSTFSKFS